MVLMRLITPVRVPYLTTTICKHPTLDERQRWPDVLQSHAVMCALNSAVLENDYRRLDQSLHCY